MISPVEFWGSIRPSGLTAEQELVELWTRLRDCRPSTGGGGGGGRAVLHRPHLRPWRQPRPVEEDEALLFAVLTR